APSRAAGRRAAMRARPDRCPRLGSSPSSRALRSLWTLSVLSGSFFSRRTRPARTLSTSASDASLLTRVLRPREALCEFACGCVMMFFVTKIDKLIGQMTLAEKIGQLTMTAAGYAVTGPVIAGDSTDSIRNGTIGNLLNLVGARPIHDMQRIAV